jgi:hypothetical protein
MSHTEGKLSVCSEDGTLIRQANGDAIADTLWSSGFDEANARRLVACWNALLPVPTEWLEQYNRDPNVDSVITENAKLRIERDELVKALRDVAENRGMSSARYREIKNMLAKYTEQS